MSDAMVEHFETVPDNTLSYLRQQLRRLMNETSDHLSTGACKEYSEYTRCCGVIEGLALAERELLDLQERLEKA
tara:strand:- start:945 stop:1166 length:222 start_codon:yes stop_codon:yes gene_type:complete